MRVPGDLPPSSRPVSLSPTQRKHRNNRKRGAVFALLGMELIWEIKRLALGE